MDGIGRWASQMLQEPAFVAALLASLTAFAIPLIREWLHDRDLENRRHRAMIEARERVGFLREWLEAQERAAGGTADAGAIERARAHLEQTYREAAELLEAPALSEPRRVRELFRSMISARWEPGRLRERVSSLLVVVPLSGVASVFAQLVYVGTWIWGLFCTVVGIVVLVQPDDLAVGAVVVTFVFSLVIGWMPAWLVRLVAPILVPGRAAVLPEGAGGGV